MHIIFVRLCFSPANPERGKIHSLNLQEKGLAGERQSLTKMIMHLTWKLSDNIVIALCFDCHGRVLSEMFKLYLFPSLCFTEVDNHMQKTCMPTLLHLST